jgi:hypothetical protein
MCSSTSYRLVLAVSMPGERLVQPVADVLVGVVDQGLVARLRRHPEGAFLLVPARVLRRQPCLRLGLAAFHFEADHLLAALVEDVGAALEEQHPEDVFLELGGVHLAAQDVGSFEEMAL